MNMPNHEDLSDDIADAIYSLSWVMLFVGQDDPKKAREAIEKAQVCLDSAKLNIPIQETPNV